MTTPRTRRRIAGTAFDIAFISVVAAIFAALLAPSAALFIERMTS